MPNRTRPDPTRRAVLTGGAALAVAALTGCTSEPSREPTPRNDDPTRSKSQSSERASESPGVQGEIISYGDLLVDGENSGFTLGIGRDKSGRVVAFYRPQDEEEWTFADKRAKFREVNEDSLSLEERYSQNEGGVSRLEDPDVANEKGKNAPHYDVIVQLPDGRLGISAIAITFRGEASDRYVVATTDKAEFERGNYGLNLEGPSSVPAERGVGHDLGGRSR